MLRVSYEALDVSPHFRGVVHNPVRKSCLSTSRDLSELVDRALTAVDTICDTLGRNEACYGNDRLKAELQDGTSFTKPADKVAVGDIHTIRTFGLDEQNGTWASSS